MPPAESENKVLPAEAWLTHGLPTVYPLFTHCLLTVYPLFTHGLLTSLKWSVTVTEDDDERLVLLSN